MINNNIQKIEESTLDKKEKPEYYKGKIFRNTKGMYLRGKIEWFIEDIKRAWHRAKNGYCRCDVWEMDYWFLNTIPHMLGDLINNMHGYPGYGDANTFENWQAILEHMKYCFEEANEDTCSQKNEWEDTFEIVDHTRTDEQGRTIWHSEAIPQVNWDRYMEREKELAVYRDERLKEGLELFNKWFRCLWD